MVTQLQNEMITLQNEKKQVLNELNSLRESQFDAIERTKRDVSSNYTLQVANLQQALVEREKHLQTIEQQFMDVKQAQSEERERNLQELNDRDQKHAMALSEHEKMHAEMLSERDRRHLERIAEITTENQSQFAVAERDSDELEAERLKMIKEKMRELHANEKRQIISEHAREKEQLQATYQKQFEDYRLQVETTANAKIKDMYDKFVEAHKAVEEEKNALKVAVGKLKDEVTLSQSEVGRVRWEKASLEEQYRSVLESHSAEIQLERKNSINLERKLADWSERAVKLETELARSESQSFREADKARSEESEAVSRIRTKFESEVGSLQSLVEEYKTKLLESEARRQQELLAREAQAQDECTAKLRQSELEHQKQLEELEARYEDQFDSLKSEHTSQVDLLEASVSEFETEKGSLEVAEEHMISLRDQLNKYRNQEKSFESRLLDLSQQHEDDISVLRKQLEAEKSAEVEQVRGDLLYRIADLESVVSSLSEASGSDDVIQNMQRQHQQELAESVADLNAKGDAALLELRASLEAAYRLELDKLTRQHADERESLTANFRVEIDAAVERTRRQVSAEMEAQMQAHIQSLHTESEKQVSELQKALSRAERETMAKSEEQVKGLTLQISDLCSEKTEWTCVRRDMLSQMELMQRQKQELETLLERSRIENNQLAEDHDRFQKKFKALEVDVSISKSAEEQKKQAMEQSRLEWERNRLELEQSRNTLEEDVGNLQTELNQVDNELERLRNEKETQEIEYRKLYDQLGTKNKAIADLQAENDALKSSVDSLCRKQQEYVDLCEKLKCQLENSWGVNEELVALKEQVIELTTYKDSFENMKLKMEYLEQLVRSKDDSIACLREDLQQVRLEETERSSHLELDLETSAKKVEALRGDVAKLKETESSLREQLSAVQPKLEESSKTTQELERVCGELQLSLKQAESRCEENVLELNRMNGMIEELNSQLAVYRNKEAKHEIEIAEKNQNIEELGSKLSTVAIASERNGSEIDKMNRIVEDMKSRITSMDAESARKSQTIQELNQVVEDLEAKLTTADADTENLQQEKSRLELDLLQSQADPDSSSTDAEFQALVERFHTLQQEYGALQEENNKLIGEVNDIRATLPAQSSASVEALEIKIQEQEATIAELRDEIAHYHQAGTPPRSLQSDADLSRSPLEATLSRARQSLTEKLQQKTAIEKELGLRRANLERQKAEKQHLEDLLFEKKRFEQELQTQKSQLMSELELLEGRLGQSKNSSGSSSSTGKKRVGNALTNYHKPA